MLCSAAFRMICVFNSAGICRVSTKLGLYPDTKHCSSRELAYCLPMREECLGASRQRSLLGRSGAGSRGGRGRGRRGGRAAAAADGGTPGQAQGYAAMAASARGRVRSNPAALLGSESSEEEPDEKQSSSWHSRQRTGAAVCNARPCSVNTNVAASDPGGAHLSSGPAGSSKTSNMQTAGAAVHSGGSSGAAGTEGSGQEKAGIRAHRLQTEMPGRRSVTAGEFQHQYGCVECLQS